MRFHVGDLVVINREQLRENLLQRNSPDEVIRIINEHYFTGVAKINCISPEDYPDGSTYIICVENSDFMFFENELTFATFQQEKME